VSKRERQNLIFSEILFATQPINPVKRKTVESGGRIIISPGPVHVYQNRWIDLNHMHHRTDEFRSVVLETGYLIGEMFGTEAPVHILTASGTGAMDAIVANITRPGSRFFVVDGGKFGQRWERIAREYKCETGTVRIKPDESMDMQRITDKVDEFGAEFIALTHVESSTGYLLQLNDFVSSLSEPRPVIILDAIASAGVEELRMDEWGVDAVVCSSQKAFAAPPGVCFVVVGDRVRKLVQDSKRSLFYFSLRRYHQGFEEGNTPFTPALQSIQMVHANLVRMKKRGWREIRERHRVIADCFTRAAEKIGLDQLARNPSSSVQAFVVPGGCGAEDIVKQLLNKHGVIVANGQGELKSSIIRTGFPGIHGYDFLTRVLIALASVIESNGYEVDIPAAERILSEIRETDELFA
jgi:aspartate aminotransferase-like enzyme